MPTYVKLKKPLPKIFNSNHFQSWDEAMQQLAIANAIISKCERCGMQVDAHRQGCDSLCSFFEGLNAEWRGPQSESPEILKS